MYHTTLQLIRIVWEYDDSIEVGLQWCDLSEYKKTYRSLNLRQYLYGVVYMQILIEVYIESSIELRIPLILTRRGWVLYWHELDEYRSIEKTPPNSTWLD
jgi:hypothetical protein